MAIYSIVCKYVQMRKPKPRLLKAPKGENKWAVERTVDGKRLRRFFPNKRLAEAHCNEIANKTEMLGRKDAAILGEVEQREAVECLKLLIPLGATLTEAVNFFIAENESRLKSKTVSEAVELWLASSRVTERRAVTVADYKSRSKKLVAAWGNQSVASITKIKFSGWMDSLVDTKGAPLKAQTRKNHRTIAHNFFGYCVEKGWHSNNPTEEVSAPKVKGSERDIFTPDQLKAAFNVALSVDKMELLGRPLRKAEQDHLIIWLALGAMQGLRASEIQRLTWKNVKFKLGEIVLGAHETKNGKRRTFPLTDATIAWMKTISKQGGELVPVGFASSKPLRGLRATLQEQHEISWPSNVLRRSFASYHYALKKDANLTSEAMGHDGDPRLLKDRYKSVVDDPALPPLWFATLPAKSGGKVVPFEVKSATG